MKNKHIFGILGVAVIVVVATFYLVGNKDGEQAVVVSDDGLVTLNLQPSALPEGLSASDISIKQVTILPDSEGELASYQFEPSGIEFSQPVTVSFDLSNIAAGEAGIPMLVNITDDGEPIFINDTNYEIDPGKGTARLSAQLDHFSKYIIVSGFFGVSYQPNLGTHDVGKRFVTNVSVSAITDIPTYSEDRGRLPIHLVPEFNIRIGIKAFPLRLSSIVPAVANQDWVDTFMEGNFASLSTLLKCEEVGDGDVSLALLIQYQYEYQSYERDKETPLIARVQLISSGVCRGVDEVSQTIGQLDAECDGSLGIYLETDEFYKVSQTIEYDETLDLDNYMVRIVGENGEVIEQPVQESDIVVPDSATPLPGVRLTLPSGEIIEADDRGVIRFSGGLELPAGTTRMRIDIPQRLDVGSSYDVQFLVKPDSEEGYGSGRILYKESFSIDACPLDAEPDEMGIINDNSEPVEDDLEDEDEDVAEDVVEDSTAEDTSAYDNNLDITGEILFIQLSDGGYYPQAQFYTHDDEGNVTGCANPHYRSNQPEVYGLKNIKGTGVVKQINPPITGCGYGEAGKYKPNYIRVTDEQWGALYEAGAAFEIINYVYPTD